MALLDEKDKKQSDSLQVILDDYLSGRDIEFGSPGQEPSEIFELQKELGKIIMEFCALGALTDVMRHIRRPLQEAEIAAVMKATLSALTYLHKSKKMHRDVKASNICLTADGRAKLVDFGVAARLESTWAKKSTQIGGKRGGGGGGGEGRERDKSRMPGGSADIWSLGITCVELAEGQPPLSHIHPVRAMFVISSTPPSGLSKPENWSDEFNSFVKRCLHPTSDGRADTSELLDHPFIRRGRPSSQSQTEQEGMGGASQAPSSPSSSQSPPGASKTKHLDVEDVDSRCRLSGSWVSVGTETPGEETEESSAPAVLLELAREAQKAEEEEARNPHSSRNGIGEQIALQALDAVAVPLAASAASAPGGGGWEGPSAVPVSLSGSEARKLSTSGDQWGTVERRPGPSAPVPSPPPEGPGLSTPPLQPQQAPLPGQSVWGAAGQRTVVRREDLLMVKQTIQQQQQQQQSTEVGGGGSSSSSGGQGSPSPEGGKEISGATARSAVQTQIHRPGGGGGGGKFMGFLFRGGAETGTEEGKVPGGRERSPTADDVEGGARDHSISAEVPRDTPSSSSSVPIVVSPSVQSDRTRVNSNRSLREKGDSIMVGGKGGEDSGSPLQTLQGASTAERTNSENPSAAGTTVRDSLLSAPESPFHRHSSIVISSEGYDPPELSEGLSIGEGGAEGGGDPLRASVQVPGDLSMDNLEEEGNLMAALESIRKGI
uniref:Protein kinase domain-containing protein n=1 Tax=Chromera velia CCMP2878 TaxID=1169474 RepID=A0A0G4G104_9ALVE